MRMEMLPSVDQWHSVKPLVYCVSHVCMCAYVRVQTQQEFTCKTMLCCANRDKKLRIVPALPGDQTKVFASKIATVLSQRNIVSLHQGWMTLNLHFLQHPDECCLFMHGWEQNPAKVWILSILREGDKRGRIYDSAGGSIGSIWGDIKVELEGDNHRVQAESRADESEPGRSLPRVETKLYTMELLIKCSLKRPVGWRRSHQGFHIRGVEMHLTCQLRRGSEWAHSLSVVGKGTAIFLNGICPCSRSLGSTPADRGNCQNI